MKIIEGACAICSQFGKLSFEHVPPHSAFNNKPIFIQTAEHLTNSSSPVYGKKKRSNRGLGRYTLCESCNNLTGDWYARDFGEFAKQGMQIINNLNPITYAIRGDYKIKPLNVIKQLVTMFMSADAAAIFRSNKELVDFVLTKEKRGLPKGYKIFLYSTLSPNKRMLGHHVVHTDVGIQKWAEINFQPFGYLIAEDSEAAHKDMCDITEFGNFNFNQEVVVELTTAYLKVSSPWIGIYG